MFGTSAEYFVPLTVIVPLLKKPVKFIASSQVGPSRFERRNVITELLKLFSMVFELLFESPVAHRERK